MRAPISKPLSRVSAEMKQLEHFLRELRTQAEEARPQELYRFTGVHPSPRRVNVIVGCLVS
jgi:hypothetical protein